MKIFIIVLAIYSFGSLKTASFSFSHFFANYSSSIHFITPAPVASSIFQELEPMLIFPVCLVHFPQFTALDVLLAFQLHIFVLAFLFCMILPFFLHVKFICC